METVSLEPYSSIYLFTLHVPSPGLLPQEVPEDCEEEYMAYFPYPIYMLHRLWNNLVRLIEKRQMTLSHTAELIGSPST